METNGINVMNGNIYKPPGDEADRNVTVPDYAALTRLAVGDEARVVPVAGTESINDLPEIPARPNQWMAGMIP